MTERLVRDAKGAPERLFVEGGALRRGGGIPGVAHLKRGNGFGPQQGLYRQIALVGIHHQQGQVEVADDVELLLVLDFEGVEHERVARPSRGKMDVVADSQLLDGGLYQRHGLALLSNLPINKLAKLNR